MSNGEIISGVGFVYILIRTGFIFCKKTEKRKIRVLIWIGYTVLTIALLLSAALEIPWAKWLFYSDEFAGVILAFAVRDKKA